MKETVLAGDGTANAIQLRPLGRLGGFGLLLTLLWLVSANYGNNLGFILTYLLAGMGMTAAWHTRRQLVGLRWRLLAPQPVFAGETVALPLEVVNDSDAPKWQLAVQVPGAQTLPFSLAAGERRRLLLPYPTRERGVQRVGPPLLTSSFPLGLFRASQRLAGAWELVVYPRPADEAPPPQGTAERAPDGELEFDGFRRYQPGDSPRLIHWKGLAKGQGLQSKAYRTVAAADETVFDWERLPSGDTEQRLRWLCRWLLEAERGGRAYGLRLRDGFVAPDRGTGHLQVCLRLLARFPRAEAA